MWDLVNKYYDNYFNFLQKEIYYELLIYCAKPLNHYYKKSKEFENFTLFFEKIVNDSTFLTTQYESLKFYLENQIEHDILTLKEYSINILYINDEIFPKRLAQTESSPRFVFYKGDLNIYIKSLSIVGTRDFDKSGEVITRYFAKSCVENGFSVVSGNAKGIDQTAQDEVLSNKGKLVIIPGAGLGYFFKYSITKEYKEKSKSILYLSEFPLSFQGNKQSFPIRNRIISALSLGTILTQAPVGSGALYTANYTLEQNKPLFIPPVEMFNEKYEGGLELLKKKDKNTYFTTNINDILEVLKIKQPTNTLNGSNLSNSLNLDAEETVIYNIVSQSYPQPVHYDKIFEQTTFTLSKFNLKIMQMLLKGVLNELPGKIYTIK